MSPCCRAMRLPCCACRLCGGGGPPGSRNRSPSTDRWEHRGSALGGAPLQRGCGIGDDRLRLVVVFADPWDHPAPGEQVEAAEGRLGHYSQTGSASSTARPFATRFHLGRRLNAKICRIATGRGHGTHTLSTVLLDPIRSGLREKQTPRPIGKRGTRECPATVLTAPLCTRLNASRSAERLRSRGRCRRTSASRHLTEWFPCSSPLLGGDVCALRALARVGFSGSWTWPRWQVGGV